METRARYAVIGSFVIAVIVAAFGFVYWLHHTGGLGQRQVLQVRFARPVAGLTPGSAVLFNGIRVGEVTGLRIEPDRPQGLSATVAVDAGTPVRADTAVDIDYQGLTGVAAISLTGGAPAAPALTADGGRPPVLEAGPDIGQNLTQAARETLRRLDSLVDENRASFKTAISGLGTFADMLGRNSGRVEEVLGGLERMIGGGGPKVPPKVYDLAGATSLPALDKKVEGQLAVPDPAAVLVFDSQKILIRNPGGTYSSIENAQWADNLPKLMQAKIVQSFENAGQLRAVSRRVDDLNADYRLTTEIRRFEMDPQPNPTAIVEFAARLLGGDGKVIDARMFKVTAPAKSMQADDALAALNAAFAQAAEQLVVWTVGAL